MICCNWLITAKKNCSYLSLLKDFFQISNPLLLEQNIAVWSDMHEAAAAEISEEFTLPKTVLKLMVERFLTNIKSASVAKHCRVFQCARSSSSSRNLRTAGGSTAIATFHHTLFLAFSPNSFLLLLLCLVISKT